MPNISFFGKKTFLDKKKGKLMAVSSLIRGEQIAERLGGRFNPTEDYENDICIYIKPGNVKFEGKPYIDIVDEENPLVRNPDIPAIACSEFSYKMLSKLPHKKLVLIPQHHCNFDKEKRTREGITTIGMIGQPGAFTLVPKEIEEKLAEKGIEFVQHSGVLTRQDSIDFFKSIDVQLIWRPYYIKLGNPLKLVNASSFGVPTIALPDNGLLEMEGFYLPAHTPDEVITQLDRLIKEPSLYDTYANKCLEKSEEYHIDSICKLYKELI
jgi:hypothetical protein